MTTSEWKDSDADHSPEQVEKSEDKHETPKDSKRKRIVVVGLGMVGIAFM